MDEQKLTILLREYDARRKEVGESLARYHQQTNFAYLYGTAIIAVITLFGEKSAALFKTWQLNAVDQQRFVCCILCAIVVIGFVLFTSALEALALIFLNGARTAAIERMINADMREPLLVWDCRITPRYFSMRILRWRGWIKPNYLVGFWMFLFFGITNGVLCVCAYVGCRKYALTLGICVVLLTTFHVYQWILLVTGGIRAIRQFAEEESGIYN